MFNRIVNIGIYFRVMALQITEIPEEPKEQFSCIGIVVVVIVVVGFILFKCTGDETSPKAFLPEPEAVQTEQPTDMTHVDEGSDAERQEPTTAKPRPTSAPQVKPRPVVQPAKESEVEESTPAIEYQMPEAPSQEPEVSEREQRKTARKARRDARKTDQEQRRQNQ